MTLLQVHDLGVNYSAHGREVCAVDRVSFELAAGEALGIVGESGSGKSQTALAVIGLLVGWALSGIDPWGLEIGFWGVMVSVLFFGSHGAWAGGIRGISHANYHLKPYLDDIRKGHYLIIVDVDREEQRKKVHRLLDHSLDVERQGDESAFSPLL